MKLHLRKAELKILFREVYEREMLDAHTLFYDALENEDAERVAKWSKTIDFLDQLETKLTNYTDSTEFSRDELICLHSGLNYQIYKMKQAHLDVSQHLELLEKIIDRKESFDLF